METLDSVTQRQEIEKWFAALAARYDSLDFIDVVNEPLHAPPIGSVSGSGNYLKALGGNGSIGYDWVVTAFRLARKYFPKSKLILNDYSIINSTTNTQKFVSLINLLKKDTLIDGAGEQAHAFTTFGTDASVLKTNLDALAATGVPLYITELDVDGLDDYTQLHEYERVFPIFWADTAVKGITLWGCNYGVWRNAQGAYLINQ
jgi:endo-1,4-beta-xylanase